MNPIQEDILMHYGVKRRSGRYPWGSGENPYQHGRDFLARVEELQGQGKSEKEIAEDDNRKLLCPGQINTYTADQDDPWKYVWLEFDGLQAAGFLRAAGSGVAKPVYQPNNMALADEVRDTMLHIAGNSNASTLHRIGHLCLFLDQLIRSSSTRQEPSKRQLRDFYVQEAITFMEQNYQRNLTVEAIAASVGYPNQLHFSRLFKQRFGVSPRKWRSQNK